MIKFYINLTYMGNSGEQLVRNWIKKLNVVTYITTKLRFFTSYLWFFCWGCHRDYLGKKKRILWERTKEHHDHNKNSVIYNHIANSKGVSYLVDLLSTNNNSAAHEKFDRKAFSVNIVKGNTCIIDKARQCDILLFKEALKIEEKCP